MSTASSPTRSPTILWAQRKSVIYLTVQVEDLNLEKLHCEENKFVLTGTNNETRYHVELELYANLKWNEHKQVQGARYLKLEIPKVEENWWPRLPKATGKIAWLKNDFDKWIEEDEVANEQEGVDKFFQQVYKNLDEDGRRAMAKSYVESAGTVLSTNWKDVGEKKVEVKPPDGLEYKEYQY